MSWTILAKKPSHIECVVQDLNENGNLKEYVLHEKNLGHPTDHDHIIGRILFIKATRPIYSNLIRIHACPTL